MPRPASEMSDLWFPGLGFLFHTPLYYSDSPLTFISYIPSTGKSPLMATAHPYLRFGPCYAVWLHTAHLCYTPEVTDHLLTVSD